MPKVIAEISIVPIGTGDTGVSAFVAEAIKALEKSRGVQRSPLPCLRYGHSD